MFVHAYIKNEGWAGALSFSGELLFYYIYYGNLNFDQIIVLNEK